MAFSTIRANHERMFVIQRNRDWLNAIGSERYVVGNSDGAVIAQQASDRIRSVVHQGAIGIPELHRACVPTGSALASGGQGVHEGQRCCAPGIQFEYDKLIRILIIRAGKDEGVFAVTMLSRCG
jgi:hypothetical protein